MLEQSKNQPILNPDRGIFLTRIRDVFQRDHRLSKVNSIYLTITHVVAALSFLAFVHAPKAFIPFMWAYLLLHVGLSLVSTTAYAHRMVSHRATKSISWPVHLLFGYIGQTLAVQGSLGEWAGRHRIHHAVDGNRKHNLDPYSAIWFRKTWQNFLWSHMLCYFFQHPQIDKVFDARTEAVLDQHKMMRLQHRWYVLFIVAIVYASPFILGVVIGGNFWTGLCLAWMSVLATIITQHITWTVNSFTHLWGTRAARSSARNNYFWLLPLGEGNHHADHHDAPTDYRNGFGFLGWCLDPTRYVLLLLRGLRLIGPLQRTSKSVELKIVAERKILRMKSRFDRNSMTAKWCDYEDKLSQLKTSLIERAKQFDALKIEKTRLLSRPNTLTHVQFQEQLEQLRLKLAHTKNELRFAYHTFSIELKSARRALAYI